jgi:hypothetical protein
LLDLAGGVADDDLPAGIEDLGGQICDRAGARCVLLRLAPTLQLYEGIAQHFRILEQVILHDPFNLGARQRALRKCGGADHKKSCGEKAAQG